MNYLHCMIRVSNLDESIDFFTRIMGLREVRRWQSEAGRFTIVHVGGPDDPDTLTIELTHNWDPEELFGGRNFGHIAFAVDDIFEVCTRVMEGGIVINRPPRDGKTAFFKTPDGISIELRQKGEPKGKAKPWVDMPNVGSW
jgi:lactoylglutathione lyase